MHPNPRRWFAISLLLFPAAALFWHLGEKRQEAARAAKQGQGVAEPAATAPVVPAGTVTQAPSTSATVPIGTNVVPVIVAGTVLHKPTNEFAFRLTNTRKPLSQLMRDERGLILRKEKNTG